MDTANGELIHGTLPSGLEYGLVRLPRRRVVSFQIVVLAGGCLEPEDQIGLTRVLGETLDKGTEHYTGKQLSDAFDEIGASHGVGTGRETVTLWCTVLPEHFSRAMELHAEILRRPTFPEDVFRVNVDLARQERLALDDDAQGLLDKNLTARALGPILGRHPLGERETLDALTRDGVVGFWRRHFNAGRMTVSLAGPLEQRQVIDTLEASFNGFGSAARDGRAPFLATFAPGRWHHEKKLEQQQVGICWPGVPYTDLTYPVQRVLLGVLSGGMSGRLFTEVREKQGLVYWVSAWQDTPRGTGMLFLGASTTPERCDRTYTTLLREVDRLTEDLADEEVERAITGIVAATETRGEQTRSRCGEMANDLFHHGRPIPVEEKIRRVQAVTTADIRRYLADHPRDRLCVVTLGPVALAGGQAGRLV
jgi:predicted Zn-dependent peptidase